MSADTVERQTEHAKAFAATRGWTVEPEHIYIDDEICRGRVREVEGA